MFRNVPGCSGMFHVPGFVDAPGNIEPLIWVSREGLLDMRKLKHFLSHARSSLLRRCVTTHRAG